MTRVRHICVQGTRLRVTSYVIRTIEKLVDLGVPWHEIMLVDGPTSAPVCTWTATLYWRETCQ